MTEHGQRLFDIMSEILEIVSKKRRTPFEAVKCPRIMYKERWDEYGWACMDCRREFLPIYPNKERYHECPCYNIGPNPSYQVTREAIQKRLHQLLNHIGNNM